jgi:Transposase IS116/IS110/IS902 family
MAYLGLVPGERSSGATIRRGGIPKAGNSFARKMLVESAWSYRRPARIGVEMGTRMPEVADPGREIAWKAPAPTVWALPPPRCAREKVAGSSHCDRARVGRLYLGGEPSGDSCLT